MHEKPYRWAGSIGSLWMVETQVKAYRESKVVRYV